MDPTKPEGVSRQSSILKPPKQRQPLQYVAPAPGSSESSPTIKIKRRVSFARNKRIREFCNEAEPGTVLDDTYEEHDSSSTKSNSTAGNEPLTITVPCHDKENFPVQLFLQTDQIECKEMPLGDANEDGDNLSQCDMEMDNTLNPNLENKDGTLYCDDGMDMTTYVPSRIIACHNQDTNFLEDKDAMELTENLPLLPCTNSTAHPSDKIDFLQNKVANSTDLTVAISQLLGAGHANKQLSDPSKYPNLSYNNENTAPMEFTSVIPSSTWIRPNSLCQSDRKTENFDNQTMELTMAVQQANMHGYENTDKIGNSLGKTNFADKSMEMTEAVPVHNILQSGPNVGNTVPETIDTAESIPTDRPVRYEEKISNEVPQDKTKIFINKSVEMTEAISAYIENCKEIQNKVDHGCMQNKTEIFANKSIEMTETIPVYIENCKEVQKKIFYNLEEDRTKYFNNKTIEMTEEIPVYIKNRDEVQNKVASEVEQNKTKIFDNKSIEMTEAIPVYIEDCAEVSKKTPTYKTEENKTKIFADKAMEMTEPISNCRNEDNVRETINVFMDKSMEMTEAVPVHNIIHKQFPTVERSPENTVPADKSMEMTETIPIFYKFHHSNYGNIPNELAKDENNMEMTEAILPSYKSPKSQENIENSLTSQLKEKTNIFANISMEMTEAVPVHKIIQSNLMTSQQEAMPEKIKVFTDTSMEMTEAVPIRNIHHYRQTVPHEESKIILNESMEMTEAVPNLKLADQDIYNTEYQCSSNRNKMQRKSLPRRKSVYDKPTEITESLASLMTKNPRNLCLEQTEFFANESMNITETIPVPQNILSNLKSQQGSTDKSTEKTRMFVNNSMNISETAPIEQNILILKHSKVPEVADKTKFFNKSMEMTEAIPGHPGRLEINKSTNAAQEKTKIFLDKSMEMTETIAILNSFPSTVQGKSLMQEGPHFIDSNNQSLISRVSTIPKMNFDADYLKSSECIASTSAVKAHHNDFIELPAKLSLSKTTKTVYSDENEKPLDKENCKSGAVSGNLNSSCNRSRSMQNVLDGVNKSAAEVKANVSTKFTDHEKQYDSTKIFPNESMEFTELPPTVGAANLSKKVENSHNQSILSNRIDPVQNPVNVSNFESFRDENFHRITSDELNSLCASMNLPIQKYSNENSSMSTQNSSIPACSNVNILRESLRKGTLFQQSNILSMQDTSVQTSTKNYATTSGKNSSKQYCDADFEMEVCRDPTKTIPVSMDITEMHGSFVNKLATGQKNFDTSRSNNFFATVTNPLVAMETDKTAEISSQRMPLSEMDIDRTADVSMKHTHRTRLPSISMDTDKFAETDINSVQQQPPPVSSQLIVPAVAPESAVPINNESNVNRPVAQECPASTTVALQNSIKITDQNSKSSSATVEDKGIKAYSTCVVNDKPGRVEIYHDVSVEIDSSSSVKTSGKRKSDETYDTVNKKNPALYAATAVCTYTQATESSNKNNNENSLSRLPSDNTEVLLATMGFKTELTYPLVINEKTVITVSQNPPMDKTFVVSENPSEDNQAESDKGQIEANKTYVVAENRSSQVEKGNPINDEVQNSEYQIPYVGIPIVKSPGNRMRVNADSDDDEFVDDNDKENQEPSVKINLFAERYSELEDIQPPSFLASDSMHDDDLSDIVQLPDDDQPDEPAERAYGDNVMVPFAELENTERFFNEFPAKPVFAEKIELNCLSGNILKMRNRRQELLEELKRLSKSDADDGSEKVAYKVSGKRKGMMEELSGKDANSQKLPACKKECAENVAESMPKEPLSPFLQSIEDIKTFGKRDDCIWSIKAMDSEIIAIEFISKSLVFIIRLKEIENIDCLRNIENIEVVSRLCANSKNNLLKIVHNLLLSKLNTRELLEKFKLYEDILPLLEFVSNEVIFAMKFMFDLEKLNALNLLKIDEKRIIFMVASRKANIILKISLALKVFEEISLDDIDVVCVLGDVRISDIKQLIVNIKRDYKFLSRYIKDVKDYITLMEESTSLHKF